jgi:hypothetical protein
MAVDIHAYDRRLLADAGYDLERGIERAKALGKASARTILRLSNTGRVKAVPHTHVAAFKAIYCGEPWLKVQ